MALRIIKKVAHRVGRRGFWLLIVAGLALAFTASLLRPSAGQVATFGGVVPLWVWAVLWLTAALVCVVDAFRSRDEVAYAVAVGLWASWSLMSLTAWALGLSARGWLGAIIYAGFSLMSWMIGTGMERKVCGTCGTRV